VYVWYPEGCWRILKSGIRIHGTDGPDQVFRTCCALHNKLLDIDGLDERWEQGVPAYDNNDGDNNDMMDGGDAGNELDICLAAIAVPDAILHLQNPASERWYGVSDERLEFDKHNRSQQSPAPVTTVDVQQKLLLLPMMTLLRCGNVVFLISVVG
jgi:hypothetical protein